ncbi:MAG: APC family permease [Thermoplasmataceae archaeon]
MKKNTLVKFIIAVKLISSIAGGILIIIGSLFYLGSIAVISNLAQMNVGVILYIIVLVSLVFFGFFLVLSYPTRYKVKFVKPSIKRMGNPSYGLWVMIGLGVGSTLGSPLFILIPENAVQYGIISILSLIIAALMSFGMAKVYSDVYSYHASRGKDIVGGPAFIKEAYGQSSLKYFISRTSMWVANSSLSAYCMIIFFDLLYNVLPTVIPKRFIFGYGENLIVYFILAMIVIWFVINAFLEEKYLRVIGRIQLVLVIIMAVILLTESFLLFSTPFNFSRVDKISFGSNWMADLLINTGYLYILFFGFQEIMAFQREVKTEVILNIPLLKKKFILEKKTIIKISMFLTVLISSVINIIYSASIMVSSAGTAAIGTASIPALYIAQKLQGGAGLLFIIIAFLIATLTTFTPSFLAASRHLKALGEDKIFPYYVSNVSWVFTLVFIGVLALAGEGFLLSITDFMVLISLGLIIFSGYHYRHQLGMKNGIIFPIFFSSTTLFFALLTYFIDPIVLLFSVLVIVFSYLIHNMLSMGSITKRIFIGIFEMSLFMMVSFMMISYKIFHFVRFQDISLTPGTVAIIALSLLLFTGLINILDAFIELYAIRGLKN